MKTLIIPAVLISAAAFITGCSSAPNTNGSAANISNQTTAQPERAPDRTPDAVAVQETPTASAETIVGAASTPTESYKTAHALRLKKDVQGLKKVMSKEILEYFTQLGKLQKQPLDAMLTQLVNKPQAPEAAVRNEKITGDRAVLEFKDEKGKWVEMDFIKEDGAWKLTLPPKKPGSEKPAANRATKPANT